MTGYGINKGGRAGEDLPATAGSWPTPEGLWVAYEQTPVQIYLGETTFSAMFLRKNACRTRRSLPGLPLMPAGRLGAKEKGNPAPGG